MLHRERTALMSANAKYRLLQGGYWMLFCAGYGYVTVFLLAKGFTAGDVGIITAVFGIAAAVLQPWLGRVADRGGKTGWKPLLLLLAGLTCADAALLCLTPPAASGVLFGALLMLISCMMPLVNAASFYYKAQGKTVDFGSARGTGSLCYALLSLVLGQLTASLGGEIISRAVLIVSVLFVLIVAVMPYTAPPKKDVCREKGEKRRGFLVRYPAFCVMLAGCVMMLAFHNITNTYLIQILENVGGDSADLGLAIALAAVMELPVMFGFSYIARRFSAGTLLVIAGAAFVLKGGIYLVVGSVGGVLAAQVLQMFSFALFASASVYYAEEAMQEQDKVTGQAWMSCTITAGAVLGNLLGGWLVDAYGVGIMLAAAMALAMTGAVLAGVSERL